MHLPPRYVNIPTELLCGFPELSTRERVTAMRIYALGWRHKYRRAGPIAWDELAELCGVKRSTLYGNLHQLSRCGILRYSRGPGVCNFLLLLDPDAAPAARGSPESWTPVQDPGLPIVVESSPDGQDSGMTPGEQQQHLDALAFGGESEGGNGTSPEDWTGVQESGHESRKLDEELWAVRFALSDLEIFEPVRSELAALEHVTVDYVDAWRCWFEEQTELGAGAVILQMRAGVPPPLTDAQKRRQSYERWGIQT